MTRTSSPSNCVARIASVTLSILAATCVVSPQPEPPSIDAERITVALTSLDPEDPDPDTVTLTGAEGAASPAGSVLSLIDIDDVRAWTEIIIQTDGSFQVTFRGRPGHELRLQIATDSARSAPLHMVVPDEDGPVVPVSNPLGACLFIAPSSDVDVGDVALGDVGMQTVTVRNECDAAVEIGALRLALGSEDEARCEDAFDVCVDGGSPTTDECDAAGDLCEETCSVAFATCEDMERPEEECHDELFECSVECAAETTGCMFDVCDEEAEACEQSFDEPHSGFGVATVETPFTVTRGATRVFFVTFAPRIAAPA